MKCELCGSGRQNSLMYGEVLTKNGKCVHTHCLYLSSGLKQNGKDDDEGILGFLLSDIAAERKRVATIQCCFCGKMRANIGCCEVRCYRNFHMICGIDCGAMNQFICTYRSFCDRHVRKIQTRPKLTDNCFICYESIFNEGKRFRAVNMIRAPCCKNGWFHKYCLQKFAKSSGYFFKCPLCNDCEKFKAHMSFWGIFVYDKDAEWELVPNAFAELLERPRVCCAETCHNGEGREQQKDSNPFIYCTTCGSVAMHRNCVQQRGSEFECDNCTQILNTDSGLESLSSQQQHDSQINESLQNIEENENLDVDVCGDSDDETNKSPEYDANTDADGDVIRLNNMHKSTVQIITDVEESANEEDEELIMTKSSYKIATAKQHIFDVSEELDNKVVEQTNARIVGKTFAICDDNAVLNCSKTEDINGDSDYSADEGMVNTFDKTQKSENFRQCETAPHVSISTLSRQSNSHNTSCIAQRTRRKSMAARPPSLDKPDSNSSDDASSVSSYQPPKRYQFFQYDEDSDASKQESLKKTADYETSDLLHAENHELTDVSTNEYESESNDESENEPQNTENRQKSEEKVRQPAFNEKDAYVNNRNRATNPLDISCIANRTRRRSSIKLRASSMHSCNNSVTPTNEATGSSSSQKPQQQQDAFTYEEGCEYIEIERAKQYTSVKDCSSNLKNNDDGELMDYFYHLLSEVKNKSNASHTHINNTRENVIKRNNMTNDSLNRSCIANRTRRRSIYSNIININEEHTEMESDNFGYLIPSSSSNNNISNNNDPNNSSNEWKSINSSSTYDSFKSSTYFGRTIKSENGTNSSNEKTHNDTNQRNEASTSSAREIVQQMAQKRKCDFDTNMPTKMSALCKTDNEPEIREHALEMSCIANRTRRKSLDKNKFKQIISACEQRESFSGANVATTPQAFTSIITISLIDTSPESTSSDIILVDTPTQESALTTTVDVPSTLTTNILPQSSTSSNISSGQSIRSLPRRFLDINKEHDYAKTNLDHSPTSRMANWSNLKQLEESYIMPRYMRVNGKLKRVSNETVRQQEQQPSNTFGAQTHFSRSYNLLLHGANENRHTSSSRT